MGSSALILKGDNWRSGAFNYHVILSRDTHPVGTQYILITDDDEDSSSFWGETSLLFHNVAPTLTLLHRRKSKAKRFS